MYLHRQVTLIFTAVTLCKLDVDVKNRTAVVGSVDFFKLVSALEGTL